MKLNASSADPHRGSGWSARPARNRSDVVDDPRGYVDRVGGESVIERRATMRRVIARTCQHRYHVLAFDTCDHGEHIVQIEQIADTTGVIEHALHLVKVRV